jgi:hypothetical protein
LNPLFFLILLFFRRINPVFFPLFNSIHNSPANIAIAALQVDLPYRTFRPMSNQTLDQTAYTLIDIFFPELLSPNSVQCEFLFNYDRPSLSTGVDASIEKARCSYAELHSEFGTVRNSYLAGRGEARQATMLHRHRLMSTFLCVQCPNEWGWKSTPTRQTKGERLQPVASIQTLANSKSDTIFGAGKQFEGQK